MKGVNKPEDQWMIILGKYKNMPEKEVKHKKPLFDKFKRKICRKGKEEKE